MTWKLSTLISPDTKRAVVFIDAAQPSRVTGQYLISHEGGLAYSGGFTVSSFKDEQAQFVVETSRPIISFGIVNAEERSRSYDKSRQSFYEFLPPQLSANIMPYPGPYDAAPYPGEPYAYEIYPRFEVPYRKRQDPRIPYFAPDSNNYPGPYQIESYPWKSPYKDKRLPYELYPSSSQQSNRQHYPTKTWLSDPADHHVDTNSNAATDLSRLQLTDPEWKTLALSLADEMVQERKNTPAERRGLRKFLNSPFGLWLISTVFVAAFSWGWTQSSAYLEKQREIQSEYEMLRVELSNRIQSLDRMTEDEFPSRYVDVVRSAIYGVRPGLQSHPTHKIFYASVYDRYERRSFRSLVVAYTSITDAKISNEISASLMAIEDSTEKIPATDNDTRAADPDDRRAIGQALQSVSEWVLQARLN